MVVSQVQLRVHCVITFCHKNGGVKKAFQDMESALRENRMTLEAIKTTQSDRDLFKHLITESTNYVAADYMRHANDRRNKLDQTMKFRGELVWFT